MSTQFLTQAISGKISFIASPKINMRKILAFSFVLMVGLLVFYVFQISKATNTAFLISKYEKETAMFSLQNKDLESNISRESSLADFEAAIQKFHYEKVGKVHYIQILGNEVAVK